MNRSMPQRPNVQAHRGYSERYPENTLLAIEEALKVGADQIEIDVGLSADGHLVIIHDERVDRTTDGRGAVRDLTLEQLKQLDAGSWKDPAFAGERIPTLSETLEAVRGRAALNIEIKSRDRPRQLVADTVKGLVALLPDARDRTFVSSFDLETLLQVKALDASLRLSLIDWDEPSPTHDGLDDALAHQLHAWCPHPSLADDARIERAVAAGAVVQVDVFQSGFTDFARVPAWIDLGVTGFSTNDPAALVAFLDQGDGRDTPRPR